MEEQTSGDSELDGLQSLRQPPEWKAIVEEVGPRLRRHLASAGLDPHDVERLVQEVIVELLRVLT